MCGSGPGFEYTFDAGIQGGLIAEVKRYLLYSHGLAFHDRLPYLLDYFHLNSRNEHARRRLHAVKSLLIEYSHLQELLRRGIVVPLSYEVFGLIPANLTYPPDVDALQAQLPHINPENVRFFAGEIIRGQIQIERANGIIDPFYPTRDYIDVFRELLRLSCSKFTSSRIEELYRVGMLADAPGLTVEDLTLADVITIRLNDEIFERWRNAIRRILEHLHENRGDYTDPAQETRAVAREVLREWRSELTSQARKNSAFGIVKEGIKGAAIGAISGSILDAHISSAVGKATVAAILKGVWDVASARNERLISTAVRQHFLVLGQ